MQAGSAWACETGERAAQQWHLGGRGLVPAPLMPVVGRMILLRLILQDTNKGLLLHEQDHL